MRDPFQGYDAWLTTDRMAEAQQAAYEEMVEDWEAFCEYMNAEDEEVVQTILGPRAAPARESIIPVLAIEEDHPDHNIYEAWLLMHSALTNRTYRLEAEAEAREYAEHDTVWQRSLLDIEIEES